MSLTTGTYAGSLLADLARDASVRAAFEMAQGLAALAGRGRGRRGGNARQRRRAGRMGRRRAPLHFAAASAWARAADAARVA